MGDEELPPFPFTAQIQAGFPIFNPEEHCDKHKVEDSFCRDVGVFSGNVDEDVILFLKKCDKAMLEYRLNSKEVAKLIRLKCLAGRAASFANMILKRVRQYPNSDYYAQQLYVQGRNYTPFAPMIPGRAQSVPSEGTVASRPSEPELPIDLDADPPREAVRPYRGRQARVPHQSRLHRREEEPEQPELPPIISRTLVQQLECFRWYLYKNFYVKKDAGLAYEEFKASQMQQRSTSVREWIWHMQLLQDKYHTCLHGQASYERQMAGEELPKTMDLELLHCIKTNSVREFQLFFQQLLANDKKAMDSVEKALTIAKIFEEEYGTGRDITAKTRSNAKAVLVMPAKAQFSTSGSSMLPHQLNQEQSNQSPIAQPQQVPSTYQGHYQTEEFAMSQQQQNAMTQHQQSQQMPQLADNVPHGLTSEQWQLACNSAAVHMAQQRQMFAASGALPRTPGGRGTPTTRGRGGANSNRGGRGGRGRGGQQGQPRQQPPPNHLHQNGQEFWNPTARELSLMSRPKADDNRPTCYYCALGGHGTSTCGHRRRDLRDHNIDRPFHPQRGHLVSPTKMRTRAQANAAAAGTEQQYQQQYQQQGQAMPPQQAQAPPPQGAQALPQQQQQASAAMGYGHPSHQASAAAECCTISSASIAKPEHSLQVFSQPSIPSVPSAVPFNQQNLYQHVSQPSGASAVVFQPQHAHPGLLQPQRMSSPVVPMPGSRPAPPVYIPDPLQYPLLDQANQARPSNWRQLMEEEEEAAKMHSNLLQ